MYYILCRTELYIDEVMKRSLLSREKGDFTDVLWIVKGRGLYRAGTGPIAIDHERGGDCIVGVFVA